MNARVNVINTARTALAGMAGMLMMASCTSGLATKEKENAIPYLTATQLLEAEKEVSNVMNYGKVPDEQLVYWDSILTDIKIKDAYYDGKKYAVDTYKNLNPEKKEYPLDLSATKLLPKSDKDILNNIKSAIAIRTSAKKYDDMRKNSPKSSWFEGLYQQKTVKYWRDIQAPFKMREAFDKGVKDANDSINNSKIVELKGLDKSI